MAVARSRGGAGAPGFVRYETGEAAPPATSLGIVSGPSALGSTNVGPLLDRDARSVARSTFFAFDSLLPPVLLRYELEAVVNGVVTTFSDDPAVGVAVDATTPAIRLLLQGAEVNPVTLMPENEPGPWVETTGELAFDNPTGFRFLIFLDRDADPTVEIQSFRLVYQI